MNCAVRNSQIADRLPFTGDTLVSSKIGKIVRKLAKDAPIPGEFSLVQKIPFFVQWQNWISMCGLPFMHQS
jgi:hypothetical protein